jgi:hypothetical protein
MSGGPRGGYRAAGAPDRVAGASGTGPTTVLLAVLRNGENWHGASVCDELHLITPFRREMLKKTRAFVEGGANYSETQTVPLPDRIDSVRPFGQAESTGGIE